MRRFGRVLKRRKVRLRNKAGEKNVVAKRGGVAADEEEEEVEEDSSSELRSRDGRLVGATFGIENVSNGPTPQHLIPPFASASASSSSYLTGRTSYDAPAVSTSTASSATVSGAASVTGVEAALDPYYYYPEGANLAVPYEVTANDLLALENAEQVRNN